MKILFYSELFIPFVGGNEAYLANVESRIKALGHETLHVTSKIDNTPKDEIIKWDGRDIPVHRTWIPFKYNYLTRGRYFFPLNARKISRIAKNFDIIHSTTFISGISGWKIGKLAKKPCLLYCNELFGDLWKEIGSNWIQKYIYSKVEKYIVSKYNYFAACSEYAKKTLIEAGVNPDKITIINHSMSDIFKPGIDGSEFRNRLGLENNQVFGFTGRLKVNGTGQSKGLLYLLKAAKEVFKELPDSRLVLGGTGFGELKPLLKKLGIQDKVIYTGVKPYTEVPKFNAMCDIMVGASITEGFGIYYAESSACGKAVVATTGGSIPEVIKHKETGLLSEPRDYETMAKNIIKLLCDKELADKYGKVGSEYVKKFSWDRSAKEHLELYDKIIRGE